MSPSIPTIFLFDIDGTLLSSGGAGRRAVERAFDELHGHPEACDGFSMAGMTDRAIVRAGLRAIGREGDDGEVDALLDAYLARLDEEVARAEGYMVHAGIDEALALATTRGFAVGLGTGNVERGARIKLSRGDLWRRFAFGGYGSDAEDRAELLRIGAERGAARLGAHRSHCRVVVIGDTPRDVEAGRAIDAEVVGVGTGPFRPDELRAVGADHAFADLAAPGALAALFG